MIKKLISLYKSGKLLFYFETMVLLIYIGVSIFYNTTNFTLVHSYSTCLLLNLTGYYCPGCGGTRAFENLVHLHLLKSFYYNPVVLIGFLFFIVSWASYILNKFTHGKTQIYKIGLKQVLYIDAIFLYSFVIKNLLIYFWKIYLF